MAEKTDVPAKATEQQLRRRDPFEMFDALHEEMARLWGQGWPFGSWLPGRRLAPSAQMPTAWMPRADVFEKNGELVVKAELPGVNKEDIQVTVDRGDLIIQGERKAESEVKEDDYYRTERSYGSFFRRMPLPADADADKIEASYADGVLEVRIPKPAEEKAQTKKVAIS